MQFFKENWIWIAIPFAVILIGVCLLIAFSGGGDGDQTFLYTL